MTDIFSTQYVLGMIGYVTEYIDLWSSKVMDRKEIMESIEREWLAFTEVAESFPEEQKHLSLIHI